jgi:hypothetical protein
VFSGCKDYCWISEIEGTHVETSARVVVEEVFDVGSG